MQIFDLRKLKIQTLRNGIIPKSQRFAVLENLVDNVIILG
jgi:hypothetical protein